MLSAGCLSGGVPVGDDDEIQSDEIQSLVTKDRASHFEMDNAFCARMCEAIAAGQEKAPFGVNTTPGTQNPKYIAAEPRPLGSSSLGDMDR
jgi:hypothetical protein